MTARRICKFFVFLNGVNDIAYFGFLALQFYLLEPTLRALLPEGWVVMSVWMTMTLVTLQMLFQLLMEGPTGALADYLGRAWAVAMSFWCRLLAIGIVVGCVLAGLTAQSHAWALLAVALLLITAQVLMATGEAFLEGSIEAWLTNECKRVSPERWDTRVSKAFDDSALVQNGVILVTTAVVLAVWQFWEMRGGIVLAAVAECLCLVGALVAHWLAAREADKGANVESAAEAKTEAVPIRARTLAAVKANLREAYAFIVKSDDRAVRRLITIIVLPFPGWVILSWFYTAVVLSDGSGDSEQSAKTYVLWLGLTLGVARVLGALAGKLLRRNGEGRSHQTVFEKAVLVNVIFLFGAALLLVVRHMIGGGAPAGFVIALFFPAVALAKGSEEVIKLSRNKLLATIVPNDETRATTLSFVSVAQNAFAFVAISLSGVLAFCLTDARARQPAIIFLACASVGVLGWLIYSRSKMLSGR